MEERARTFTERGKKEPDGVFVTCSKVCTSREKELNGKLPGGISLYIRHSAVISKSGRV
jgi:hypothetical protein